MLDKSTLLGKRLTEKDVEVPNVGTVRVRAISRAQALALGVIPNGQPVTIDLAEAEQKLLSAAMVEPTLTREEVKEWQANSAAGEINVVFMAIIRLSGLAADLPKDVVKQFPQ